VSDSKSRGSGGAGQRTPGPRGVGQADQQNGYQPSKTEKPGTPPDSGGVVQKPEK
jgi:hypothetical protein